MAEPFADLIKLLREGASGGRIPRRALDLAADALEQQNKTLDEYKRIAREACDNAKVAVALAGVRSRRRTDTS